MQWAVRVNEAYQRLKDPLQARRLPVRAARRADRRRAQHRDAAAFLMQQMAWREALDEADERRAGAGAGRGRWPPRPRDAGRLVLRPARRAGRRTAAARRRCAR
jgi:DnaJ-domain-containing protein 1